MKRKIRFHLYNLNALNCFQFTNISYCKKYLPFLPSVFVPLSHTKIKTINAFNAIHYSTQENCQKCNAEEEVKKWLCDASFYF